MTRAEQRELKRELNNEIAQFFKIQNHYFPYLIQSIRNVLDGRNQSYTTYEIEVILYVMILKNVCSIESMKEMTEAFNEDELVKNVYKILKLNPKEYLPHYVTINECLSKLDSEELEKIRKNMIYGILRKRSFQNARFLKKYWCVIIDATQLYSFEKRHCEHCLTKTFNKGEENEKTMYYHQVLEAKVILGDNLVFSIGTEFIENEQEELTKQDCERKAFKRLAKNLKKMFPRLPICIMGDSLYACEPVFEICNENKWEFLIRYKDGSIPTLAEEYCEIKEMGAAQEKIVDVEEIYKRKSNVINRHNMRWVNDLDYNGYMVTVMELEIERWQEKSLKFQWITSMEINNGTAKEFADTGRKRWLIENEGFKIQKHHRYIITHKNSLNHNALKNHYLITQIADILVQLYENGIKGIKELKRTIENVSKGLLECLKRMPLNEEDLEYERIRVANNEA
jgi:hypothetical protein